MAKQTITITFIVAPPIEDAIYVELDAEMNFDKTQFVYGEKAYFKVYTIPSDLAIILIPTDGSISAEGSGTETIEDELLTFTETEEGENNQTSVSKPVVSIISSSWLGNSLGALSAAGFEITATQLGVGVCKITYSTSFRRYALSLSAKDEDSYIVVVLISSE